MDNFHIDIIANNRRDLEHALAIVFNQHHSAVAYKVLDEPVSEASNGKAESSGLKRLIFYWTSSAKDAIPLPFALDAAGAVDWAVRWLAEQDYGPEMDHDGHNSKGWRVYNEAWGPAIIGSTVSRLIVWAEAV